MHICTIKESFDHGLPKLPRHSNPFKKIFRWFRMTTLVSSTNPRSRSYYRTLTAIGQERKRHIESNYTYVIHPFSNFRTMWETVMMVVFFLYLTNAPFFVAFYYSKNESLKLFSILAIFLDFACIIDICMTCFTGYVVDFLELIELNPFQIRKHYLLSSLFVFDVISSIPTELVAQLVFLLTHGKQNVGYLNLLSLLKIYRLKTLLTYMSRTAELLGINHLIFGPIRYIILSFLVLHWCGCMYYIIPTYVDELSNISNNNEDVQSWILRNDMQKLPLVKKYIWCIFKAASNLLCIVNFSFADDLLLDMSATIVVHFLGYILSLTFLVIFLHGMSLVTTSDVKYNCVMNQLSQYMRHKQLPMIMQKRLIEYYEYRYRLTYFREQTLFPSLSERLRREINNYIARQLIKKVTLLREIPPSILNRIINNLKPEVYLPNDIIIKAGMTGDCMYFIYYGTVAVYTPTGKEVCHLQDGAYFGEMGLIMKDQKRIANVVALETSEIYRLDKKCFNQTIKSLPDLYKKIERVAERRRENTMVMEEIHRKHILEKSMKLMDVK